MKNHELRNKNYEFPFAKIFCVLLFFLYGINHPVRGQSTNQSYPTPITSNEISGKISARDAGDARLTDYYYVFNGRQGDIFINVVTSNFNGDIDVFTAENLKPLTKITIYADESDRETGRVIYLRQPEKLVLRIEGRSPNDDPANFSVKFAGSFQPAQVTAENIVPEAPEVKSENETGIRVNSVGTIIETQPKPAPPPTETIAKEEPKNNKPEVPENVSAKNKDKENTAKEIAVKKEKKVKKKVVPQIVVTDDVSGPETVIEKTAEKNKPAEKPADAAENKENKKEAKKENTANAETSKNDVSSEAKKSKKSVKSVTSAELENIKLVVLFKDGTKIERPMSEVLKVNVDKGILTVISKDGAIGRYSILDVAKMTIE